MVWLIAAVNTGIPWPAEDYSVSFKGRPVLLRSATSDRMPAICIEYAAPETMEEMHLVAREFMSELCWIFPYRLVEVTVSGASHCMNIGPAQQLVTTAPGFYIDYLPELEDPNPKLALAFYREAKSVNSVPYSFLGYWKIVSMLYGDGSPDQRNWLIRTLPLITEHRAKKRITELRNAGSTDEEIVRQRLYVSRRCAIAHATSAPRINPDDPTQEADIRDDLPIVKAIAEYAIENEFGVKSRLTVFKEHLYELEGFRRVLGEQTVETIKSGTNTSVTLLPRLPSIDLRIAGKAQLPSLSCWELSIVRVDKGIVFVACKSKDGLVKSKLALNFRDERFVFEPWEDIFIQDDGSPLAASAAAECMEFGKDLLCNGRLQIYQSGNGSMLGRKDAYIGNNIDLGATLTDFEQQISHFKNEVIFRSQSKPVVRA